MTRLAEARAAKAAGVQGIYFLATGIWPLVAGRSFQAVTGRKRDFWLAQTVGALVAVAGAALLVARGERGALRSRAIRTLAIGSAASLAAVDVVFVARRRISPLYLADAAAEVAIVVTWLSARDPGGCAQCESATVPAD